MHVISFSLYDDKRWLWPRFIDPDDSIADDKAHVASIFWGEFFLNFYARRQSVLRLCDDGPVGRLRILAKVLVGCFVLGALTYAALEIARLS